MRKRFIFIYSLIILIVIGCSAENDESHTTELTVSAAASLTNSLTQLNEVFEKNHPNIEVDYNFGGSGSLRRQIEQGAPIDIFLSASRADYEKLLEQERVDKGIAFLKNDLILITLKENSTNSLEDFMVGNEFMAVGTAETVPAGFYTKEVLQNLGDWELLEEEERLIFTKDVTQVLTYVKEGAAEIGAVYASDIVDEKEVKIIQAFDSELHSPIRYYMAKVDNGETSDSIAKAIEAYYQFLSSEEALKVFESNGFQKVE